MEQGTPPALVTFGEAMLRYTPRDGERLEVADALDVWVAGSESNIAVAATRAGTDALWFSKLPDSALGRRAANALHEAGLETDIVWTDNGRQGIYYVEQGTEPRGTSIQYDRADAAITTATPAELPTHHIREAELFATSGITPALSDTLVETTDALLSLAQDNGTTTLFDLNYRSKLWSPRVARETIDHLCEHVDILVIGEDDAEIVFEETGEPEDITGRLIDRWGLETVILTRGAWGAVLRSGEAYIEQRSFETTTVDPIGTGDAFVGGYVTRFLEGADLQDCMAFGAATAALARTIPGDIAIVTREEIERVIETGHGGISR